MLTTVEQCKVYARKVLAELHVAPIDDAMEDLQNHSDLFCPVMVSIQPVTEEEFKVMILQTLEKDE